MTRHEAFLERYGRAVRRMVERAGRGLPRHLREDLEQAAQVGVLRGVASYDAASGRVFALFVLDCVRTELNAVTRPERRQLERATSLEALAGEEEGEPFDVADDAPGADGLLEREEERVRVTRAVVDLKDNLEFTVVLDLYDDPPRTYEAIAGLQGITVGQVRAAEARALAHLKKALAAEEE